VINVEVFAHRHCFCGWMYIIYVEGLITYITVNKLFKLLKLSFMC